jgi:hypothetical protein
MLIVHSFAVIYKNRPKPPITLPRIVRVKRMMYFFRTRIMRIERIKNAPHRGSRCQPRANALGNKSVQSVQSVSEKDNSRFAL